MLDSVGRSLGFIRLQHYQIICRRLSNYRERNPRVERDEPSFLLNRKGKKVYVSKLPWAMNSRRVHNVGIQQADHDTYTPVLRDRAGSPALSRVLLKPPQCDNVRRMIGVEQCNEYVDVQQRAH